MLPVIVSPETARLATAVEQMSVPDARRLTAPARRASLDCPRSAADIPGRSAGRALPQALAAPANRSVGDVVGVFAGVVDTGGQVTQFDVAGLGRVREQFEGLVGGQAMAFDEDAESLPDGLTGLDRLL